MITLNRGTPLPEGRTESAETNRMNYAAIDRTGSFLRFPGTPFHILIL
jgi:hypothetical protein